MRARNVKPGFFQNEQIAELSPETRLLFIGLWLMADREGRLEDRPKRIKMQLFPADSWDVEPMLDSLAQRGLIIRYQVDGRAFIAIPTWAKHQRPHPNEKASVIPPPNGAPRYEADRTKEISDPSDSLNPDCLNPDCSPPERVGSRSARRADALEADGEASKPAKRKTAQRIPDDFELTDERRLVAEAERLPAERTFAKFVDYWRAASGAKARKHDWDAAWRNWCRTEADFRSRGSNGSKEPRKTRFAELTEALDGDE